jgi:ATP-binding cassette subfamily F protein 3
MLQATDLSKSYGSQLLLDHISFNINSRERVGLIGRNGHGKTTLFRIIAGVEDPDTGTISLPKNYKVGYLEQHLKFTQDTVLKEACLGLRPEHKEDFWRAEKMLSGLGFAGADMNRHPGEFSGGFQVRIQLAKVIAGEPNLLLLDEPTNYLDIVSIRWLERFLIDWKHELILITHDRSFMDKVCSHTMVIHRRKVRKIEGSTEKLYDQIIKEEEMYEKTRQNDEKRQKEIETFISRFRAKARLGGLVQSRVKMLEKKEKMDKLEKIKSLEFSFRAAPESAKWTVEAQNLSFSYSGKKPFLIEKLNILVDSQDRIGIIGKNGKGKSTLIKLFAGILQPSGGETKTHPNVKIGYFGQTNIDQLHPLNTVEEEIVSAHPERNYQEARNIAGSMLFEGDAALKKVSVLSGGEKSRVLLGKLLVSPSHLLLLDEPTNHLDMQSCDSLIAAIDSFEGAVMIVTHNEMYLSALVNRLIVFDNGRVFVYEGGYSDFLKDVGWQEEADLKNKDLSENSWKAQKKARAELVQEKSRVLKPLENQIKEIEKEITRMETGLHQDHQELINASTKSDGPEIARLAKKSYQDQAKINTLYEELTSITEQYEKEAERFIG